MTETEEWQGRSKRVQLSPIVELDSVISLLFYCNVLDIKVIFAGQPYPILEEAIC